MEKMTAAEAWEGFVGEQTPEEFVAGYRDQGITNIDEMARAYVADLPTMFDGWNNSVNLEEVAVLLARYIRQSM